MHAQTILDALNYAAAHIPWAAIGASGILSPLLLGLKKWFSVQSEKVMISLVALVALATAAGHYLLTTPIQAPGVIAIQAAVLAFMTQPIYFFVVKPAAAWFGEQLAKAAAFDAQVKSAIEPVNGLPLGAGPATEDFSH